MLFISLLMCIVTIKGIQFYSSIHACACIELIHGIIQETKYVSLFLFEQSQLGNFSSLESALAEALQHLFFLRSFLHCCDIKLLSPNLPLTFIISRFFLIFTALLSVKLLLCYSLCHLPSPSFHPSLATGPALPYQPPLMPPKERVDTLILPTGPTSSKALLSNLCDLCNFFSSLPLSIHLSYHLHHPLLISFPIVLLVSAVLGYVCLKTNIFFYTVI